jgi:hypothetical protein
MINCCAAIGATSKLAIGSSAGTPTRMDFIDFLPAGTVKMIADGGLKAIRGTLDPIDNDIAEGMLFVRFHTRMWLTSAKMDILLPQMGFTESPTDTFTLVDAIDPSKIIVGNGTVNKEYTYDGCIPTDWKIRGQKGRDPIMLDIGWVGKTWAESVAGTFFTSQSSPAMTEGYIYPFPDGSNNNTTATYTLNSADVALEFPQVLLSMDYGVIDEFNNSLTATYLCPTKHELKFGTSAFYGNGSSCTGQEVLVDIPLAGDVTKGGKLVLDFQRTVGANNNETKFTVAALKLLARPPRIVKGDFLRLPIDGIGVATGTTPLLVVVNKNNEA